MDEGTPVLNRRAFVVESSLDFPQLTFPAGLDS